MMLRIQWSGYTSMTYEIPVDGYEGRVQLQTLARRIARACVHFLQVSACSEFPMPLRDTDDHCPAGEHDPYFVGPRDAISPRGNLCRSLAARPLHQLNTSPHRRQILALLWLILPH